MTTQEQRRAREADDDAQAMEGRARFYTLRGRLADAAYWQQQAEAAREQARRYRGEKR